MQRETHTHSRTFIQETREHEIDAHSKMGENWVLPQTSRANPVKWNSTHNKKERKINAHTIIGTQRGRDIPTHSLIVGENFFGRVQMAGVTSVAESHGDASSPHPKLLDVGLMLSHSRKRSGLKYSDLQICRVSRPLLRTTGTPFTHVKTSVKFWGLPRKCVSHVRWLPWKLVGNSVGRNYFQSDVLRLWSHYDLDVCDSTMTDCANISSELKYYLIFTHLSEPGLISAGFQWTGPTPAGFQEAFRADCHHLRRLHSHCDSTHYTMGLRDESLWHGTPWCVDLDVTPHEALLSHCDYTWDMTHCDWIATFSLWLHTIWLGGMSHVDMTPHIGQFCKRSHVTPQWDFTMRLHKGVRHKETLWRDTDDALRPHTASRYSRRSISVSQRRLAHSQETWDTIRCDWRMTLSVWLHIECRYERRLVSRCSEVTRDSLIRRRHDSPGGNLPCHLYGTFGQGPKFGT